MFWSFFSGPFGDYFFSGVLKQVLVGCCFNRVIFPATPFSLANLPRFVGIIWITFSFGFWWRQGRPGQRGDVSRHK